MPTGFGKTYNVFKFIYDNYKEFAAKNRKILFLTNLKKNLALKDLKNHFIENGNEDDYNKYVLFIDSNSETVIKNFIDIDDEIPDEFKNTEKYKKLKKCIEIYQTKQLPKEVKDNLETQIRKELEPIFRTDIQAKLKEKFSSKKARLQAIKDKQDYQWVGKLYPAVFTDEKTVLFLSMDKFIRKNTTLIEPSYSFHERLNKNSLIFIDEFDTTKENVLKNIIESGLRHQVDILDLFLNIHNHLIPSKDPESLIKESEDWQKKSSGKDWLSPQQQIQSFREKANEIFNKYKLQHTCKSHPEFSTKKRNFLFYDYKFHNVINRKKRIEIIEAAKKRTNWINAFDIEVEKQGIDIHSLLGEISGFLTYFQRGISNLADNYLHLKEEDKSIQEVFNLEFAVESVLNHFRLDSADVAFLANNIMAGELPYKFSTEKQITKLQGFYDRGFRYYDIVDSDKHDTLSKIYMFNFNRTPELFLAEVCSKAMVVGISATAGLHTNIGNYDIEYLKSRLADSFIHLQEDEIIKLQKDYSQATQGYDKVTIKPKFIGKEADNKDKAIKQLEELLNDEHTANRLWYDLEHKIKGEQKYIEFLFCRYVRALTAWKYFIDNPDCHSFLCFFNKSPKHNDPEFDLKILYEYAELLLYDNKDAIADSISKTIVVLTGDNFDDLKKEISNDLKENKRRFIISTYKTIGVGQNLQFGIPSSIKPIHINSFTESKYMDINGIYLDKPTNLLININNENIKDDDFIEYIFQLEFLRENGAFSQNIFKSKLDEAFRRYVGMDKYQKKADDFISLYNTDAYSLFLNKVIIQAIGRICRTNMKAPTIHILADDNIRKHLTKFSLPEDVIPVHEYTALLKLAGEPINKSQDLIKSQNIASLRSDQTYNYIYSQINTPWRSESVKEWQDLREQVLCQPAIAKESDCNLKWNIYVKLPKPTNSYYFSQENDYREIEIFFSDEYGKKQVQKVSEQTSRLSELMRINILRKLFINEGYATEFPESELMLTPPMFNNIYKGALGEVCGKHILETILKIPLLELEINEFERFDFKIDQNIYIDFKLWNDKIAVEADQEIEKIRNKMDEVGAEKVFIINILGSSDSPFRERISSDSKIVQVPYLCKNDQIDNEAITFIMKEFKK
jgi:hypothetical protein